MNISFILNLLKAGKVVATILFTLQACFTIDYLYTEGTTESVYYIVNTVLLFVLFFVCDYGLRNFTEELNNEEPE